MNKPKEIHEVKKESEENSEHPFVKQLEQEITKVSSITKPVDILAYLSTKKPEIDKILSSKFESSTAATDNSVSISEIQLTTEKSEGVHGGQKISTVDSIIAKEILKYSFLSNKKALTNFLDDVQEQIRQEATPIICSDKYLVQASYIPIYFEEKFIVFRMGHGDFAHENFAKLILEFCNLAVKEYKRVDAKKEFGLHPIYFCYVSENEYDFYLVEYDPNNTKLQVYLTSAPMFGTLYKHLSKVETNKVDKKSFHITTLNFLDKETGIEFRQLFFNSKTPINQSISEEEVPDKIRYFIFVVLFMLRNSNPKQEAEINFGCQDFITFFNYMADYQAVYLRHHNNKEPIPPLFESCYPFVDLRKPKQSFLMYSKSDEGRGRGIVSVRQNVLKDNFFTFENLYVDEDRVHEENLRIDLAKFLKKPEGRTALNFDGPSYITTYIRRNRLVDGFFKVIDKKQGQAFHDIFAAGDSGNKLSKIYDDSSKFSKIVILFPCIQESNFLLMTILNRREKTILIYTFTNSSMSFLQEQNPEKNEGLKKFIFFLADKFKLDVGKLSLRYIQCRSNDEAIIQYYKRNYFPYTYLLELEKEQVTQTEITIDHLYEPFKTFLSLNVSDNNLDVFKAYNLLYEDMIKSTWKVINLQTLWKYSEFLYALDTFANKIYEDNLKHCIISFNFIGLMGRKTYYIYLREKAEEEHKESSDKQTKAQYLIDIISLSNNFDMDDKELLAELYQFCLTSYEPRFIYNAAYKINSKNNILIHTQIEVTLTSLAFLINSQNSSFERAFQKISQSIVSHYEILENIMEHAKRESSQLQKNQDLENSHLNLKIHNTIFEEAVEDLEFQKKLEIDAVGILDKLDLGSVPKFNVFVDTINCQEANLQAFTYLISEDILKRILQNENGVLTDKNFYQALIADINKQKHNYEEALHIVYPENQIFFLLPSSVVETEKIAIIKYCLNKRNCVYYHLSDEKLPKINSNVVSFMEALDAEYFKSIGLEPANMFEIIPFELQVTPELGQVFKSHISLIHKFLIYLFSGRTSQGQEKIELDANSFNTFLCEYSLEIFGNDVQSSLLKQNYRPLSSMFLQTNSLLTKKPALLTFLNGTATIEQLNVINGCIGTFKNDFNKIKDVEHAFFCFNVGVKSSIKHFLLHLYGKDRKSMSLRVFTNAVGDSDAIIDRIILTYLANNETGPNVQQEGLKISNISMYKIDIVNKIFTSYLEISSFLMAHAVCNDMKDSAEVCGQLAFSSVHYLNELKTFETKCKSLDLLKQPVQAPQQKATH